MISRRLSWLLVAVFVCAGTLSAFAQNCPELVGVLPGSIDVVTASGDHAYLCGNCFSNGGDLHVADVSDPSEPQVVGQVEMSDLNINQIAVQGDYAYVAGQVSPLGADLRVIDVSDPSMPVEVSFVDLPGSARDVAVSSGYAYVANLHAGLRVIDVSEPTAPVEVGFFDMDGLAYGVSVSEGYVFVADGNGGLKIFRECGVFIDGFESGDTSAWSLSVP